MESIRKSSKERRIQMKKLILTAVSLALAVSQIACSPFDNSWEAFKEIKGIRYKA